MSRDRVNLQQSLLDYAHRYPGDAHATDCLSFLASASHPFDREYESGHFTGSAWLVDASGKRVLLTHHRKLNRWLQLGGHADGDSDLAAVALREAEEESGIPGLTIEYDIFDVDRHWIPERTNESGHWHYDVRYVVRAGVRDTFAVSDESLELAWVQIDTLATARDTDESLRRMAQKWLTREANAF
jgi:8-oxo-dGTP pyrophosphatase MutT (NUDIX family)